MPRPSLTAALTAALLAGLASPAAAQTGAEGIETSLHREAGLSVQGGEAVGEVDAPYDEVVRVVQDFGNYHHFLPHFRSSRVLAQRGGRAMVYMEVGILRDTITLWAQLRIQSRDGNGRHIVEARMMQGNMDGFIARWEVEPLDGGQRARVRFRILVDPDVPVPSSVITAENVKSARRTIKALRQRVVEVRQG